MRYQLKSDLLKNHDIDNNLLNVDRIRSRASSLDILYSFNEDENEVYLYDFIAYLFSSSSKVEDSNYENYIMSFIVNMNEDKIIFSRDNFEKFFNYSKKMTISSELKNIFCGMYVYNEAYIENRYFIESPIHNLEDDEVLELMRINDLLKKEINYLKNYLIVNIKDNRYKVDIKRWRTTRLKARRDAVYLNNEEIMNKIIKNTSIRRSKKIRVISKNYERRKIK